MNDTYTQSEVLVVETCCNCGVAFGMTVTLHGARKRDGGSFYCPNGHGQHYTESTEAKLKQTEKDLKTARSNAQYYREEAEAKARSLSAIRGQITKIKNRISKGVCPCCSRSFENLHRHMENKHPGYNEVSNG